jgi:pimeloyl-ACP methyl ester carboxylesterase
VLDSPTAPGTDIARGVCLATLGLTLSIYCGELHYSKLSEGPGPTVQAWPDAVWRNLVPDYFDQCKTGLWPIKPIDRSLLNQVNSDIPTLILLGEIDPITSLTEAKRSIAGLTKGILVTVRETTHATAEEPCALEIMARFVDTPTASPDQGCQASIARRRYRVDL